MYKSFFLLIFLSGAIISCTNPANTSGNESDSNSKPDLPDLRERNKLIALTDFNATNYFIYRGEPMGYQYDLLNEFSKALNIDFEIIVDNDLQKSFRMLQDGKCDLLALNLTITQERSRFLKFTYPHTSSRQVLVQRKPNKYQFMHPANLEKRMLRNQLDLAGKTVFVQKNSSYASRLHNLAEEIGDSIKIIEVEESLEELIIKVANGEIDYTISDENMAKVNQTFYPNIDIKTAVSFPQNLAWAIRKDNSDLLLDAINSWLIAFKRTTSYALIYNKYFRNPKSGAMAGTGLVVTDDGQLSQWDPIIKKYSDSIPWDWRLLASMIYQESRFYADTTSWAGAHGLMQIMPTTAKQYNIDRYSSPEKNIEAGVKYLKWLDGIFTDKVEDPVEKYKFVLASYNAGLGHVLDARALAVKFNKDPMIWEGSVDEFILKKSNPRYYLDPVVKYGYCRGQEVYNYVEQIFARYEDYKNIIPLN
ncbi:MAG: transporter substrate-binding domain-containing protein [Bacteroidota bacterium]|nr:transporter substrate-binding domain-containing protein [Bacteroidota bacterium]